MDLPPLLWLGPCLVPLASLPLPSLRQFTKAFQKSHFPIDPPGRAERVGHLGLWVRGQKNLKLWNPQNRQRIDVVDLTFQS